MARYSQNFINDFNWYLSVRHIFSFDGSLDKHDIPYDKNGVDAKRAFLILDAQGKIVPTRHPNIVRALLKTKGSINLYIKMYAEDRYNGLLPRVEFIEMCEEFNAPEWFYRAVENQKEKMINKQGVFRYDKNI